MRICFVAHSAYAELAGRENGHIGGIERQQGNLARWLARRGHEVSMVTWDEGQTEGERVAGVRVWKLCRRGDGIRGLRFLHPRWTSLRRALRRADTDVYYYNCGDLGLGQVVQWCRAHGRRCVYSVASELDCTRRPHLQSGLRERLLYRHGLLNADRVIVQTQRQKELLREHWNLEGLVIPMPGTDASDTPPAERSQPSPRVLWVGRISAEKRLEWLLDLAERHPERTFGVAGAANASDEYSDTQERRARSLPNVRLYGRVGRARLDELYRQAGVLCCTSLYEGFPNTFLEAWCRGLPVVSTFDPDGLIASNGLGAVASSLPELSDALRSMLQDGERWRQACAAAREYYLRHHDPDIVNVRFEEALEALAYRAHAGAMSNAE